jgi:excisionase family DNA binding protein
MKSSAPSPAVTGRKSRALSLRVAIRQRDWLTTTEVAKLVGVCRATVVKMCGRSEFELLRAGCGDDHRRISKQSVREFFRRNKHTPPAALATPIRITLGCNTVGDLLPVHWFQLSQVLSTHSVSQAVIGTDAGLWLAIEAAREIKRHCPESKCVLILGEDQQHDDDEKLFAAILRQPIHTSDILAELSEMNP